MHFVRVSLSLSVCLYLAAAAFSCFTVCMRYMPLVWVICVHACMDDRLLGARAHARWHMVYERERVYV